MSKKILNVFLVTFLVFSIHAPVTAAENTITVSINGTPIKFDQPPIIENGHTLVPLRAIFEALGAVVDWNGDTQTVVAVKGKITIILQIGSKTLFKNLENVSENITLDVPARIVGDRILVPARAVAESFGAEVNWNRDTQTVVIITSNDVIESDINDNKYNFNAWALGCSAILGEENHRNHPFYDPYQFGMSERSEKSFEVQQRSLQSSWSIYSSEDLIDTIKRMTDNGHNSSFVVDYELISGLNESEYQSLLEMSNKTDKYMWALTKTLGEKWGNKQIKAWDWFRMIHLAGWGYTAGYLELGEAHELMIPVIERLKSTFSSWDEATENYMDGYAWWSRTDVSEPNTKYKQRLGIYEELKARTGELDLFDPSVWD